MASVVGNGWRSRGLGSLGIRSSGSTCTCVGVAGGVASSPHTHNTYSHLPLARTEIEVQTSLKPLLNELWVARDLSQTIVSADNSGEMLAANRFCRAAKFYLLFKF